MTHQPKLSRVGVEVAGVVEQEIVYDIARELVAAAVERHKHFQMPLPEFDEIEERLKKEKEKKAASLQS